MDYVLSVGALTAISLTGMLAIYILTGLTGLFSMGQASFMAIGGYTAGMLTKSFGLPMPLGIIAAIMVGVFFGFLLGMPTLKLQRDYIALITFGFGGAVVSIITSAATITGGAQGLIGVPKIVTPLMAFAGLIITIAIVFSFKKSKYGRQCIAIKSDELAAAAMGINVARMKLTAFMLAGAITSFAGAMFIYFTTYIDPSGWGFMRSAEWIIIVFFGGISSLTGAVVAGVFFGLLTEFLRQFSQYRIIIYCIVILIIVNFRPQGLLGTYEISFKSIKNFFLKIGRFIKGIFSKKTKEDQ